jgi:hypothetical protein
VSPDPRVDLRCEQSSTELNREHPEMHLILPRRHLPMADHRKRNIVTNVRTLGVGGSAN